MNGEDSAERELRGYVLPLHLPIAIQRIEWRDGTPKAW
jgi:hypothetical protein